MDAFVGSILVVPFNFAPVGWAMCAGQVLQVNQNQALFSLIGNTYGGSVGVSFGVPDLRGRSVVGAMATGSGTPAANYTLGQTGGALTAEISQVPAHTHGVNQTLAVSGLSASGPVNLPVTASFSNQTVTVTGKMQASTEPASADAPFNGATMADLNPGVSPKIYGSPSTDPSKQVQLTAITSTGTFSATSTGSASGTVTLPATGALSGTVTVQPNSAVQSVSVPTVGPFLALNPIICLMGIYPSRP
jgi:microcystin-dependent protein